MGMGECAIHQTSPWFQTSLSWRLTSNLQDMSAAFSEYLRKEAAGAIRCVLRASSKAVNMGLKFRWRHSTGAWFSESMDATLGVARPNQKELQRLVLDLLQIEWGPETNGSHACCIACGSRTSKAEERGSCCEGCRRMRGIPRRFLALGHYETGWGRLLAQAKYSGWRRPFFVLGWHLGEELMANVETARLPVLIPMPSPWLRRWHRGLDHTLAIAEGISRATGWPVGRWLRRSWRPPQVGATRTARSQGGGGLRVPRGAGKRLKRSGTVVLVDDVRTTGASLARASRLCRRQGVVDVLAAVVAIRNQR